MGHEAWQDGRVPWRRRALSAVPLMTIAVAGERVTMAAGPRGSDSERMACGDARRPPVRLPVLPAGVGDPKDVYVVVEAHAHDTTDGPLPMASILFVKGQPTTHITVHAGHVARRLATLRLDDRPLAEQPRMIRDRILGRVLGRVLAHEVGHFLSGSRAHAKPA